MPIKSWVFHQCCYPQLVHVLFFDHMGIPSHQQWVNSYIYPHSFCCPWYSLTCAKVPAAHRTMQCIPLIAQTLQHVNQRSTLTSPGVKKPRKPCDPTSAISHEQSGGGVQKSSRPVTCPITWTDLFRGLWHGDLPVSLLLQRKPAKLSHSRACTFGGRRTMGSARRLHG